MCTGHPADEVTRGLQITCALHLELSPQLSTCLSHFEPGSGVRFQIWRGFDLHFTNDFKPPNVKNADLTPKFANHCKSRRRRVFSRVVDLMHRRKTRVEDLVVRLTAFTFRGSTLWVKDHVERPPNLKPVSQTGQFPNVNPLRQFDGESGALHRQVVHRLGYRPETDCRWIGTMGNTAKSRVLRKQYQSERSSRIRHKRRAGVSANRPTSFNSLKRQRTYNRCGRVQHGEGSKSHMH